MTNHTNRIHLKERFRKCDSCEFSAYTKAELIIHTNRKHTRENADLYHCKYKGCDHSTISKDDLTRHHQRIHQKIKRRQCDLCTFTGFTNGDLK